ncbi:Hypothetical predicted protein, partial [Marmota monax]
PQRTHQAAMHRKCRRAKLNPEHSAIAGTFLAETIFATCHTLSLFTFPGSQDALSGVRGEGRVAPAACAHSRSHSPALTLARAPPARAAVGVCVHAGQGRRNLPFLAPSFPRSAFNVYVELCIPLLALSCRHIKVQGLTWTRLRRKA